MASNVQDVMQIFLVRHGKPRVDERKRVRGREYRPWADEYDTAPLDMSVLPPDELRSRAVSAGCVVTSTIPRARASAALLVPNRPVVSDPVFNEPALPRDFLPALAFRPGVWDFLARVAWFSGWSRSGESFREARTRARDGTKRLANLANEHGSVMLVGHGIMNALIRQYLRRAGWSTSALRSAYWSLMVAESRR